MAEPVRVCLPYGLWRDGMRHQEAEINPLNGADEAFLLDAAGGQSRADIVSRLLARCVGRIGGIHPVSLSDIRELSVGDREALLLHLRGLSFGRQISCIADCPAPGCGRPMDLDLDTDALLVPAAAADTPHPRAALAVDSEEWMVTYRVPTGGDQEAIAPIARRDVAEAADALLHRCVMSVADGDGRLVPMSRARTALQRLMPPLISEYDPQAEIRLTLQCPDCEHEFDLMFDTADYLAAEMAVRGRTIFDEVHLIASRYHWSESDILSLDAGRRRRYLSLIFDDMSAEART